MYSIKGSNDTTNKTQAVQPFAAHMDGHHTFQTTKPKWKARPIAIEISYTQIGDYLIADIW